MQPADFHLHATACCPEDVAALGRYRRGFRAICQSSPDAGKDQHRPWPTLPVSPASGSRALAPRSSLERHVPLPRARLRVRVDPGWVCRPLTNPAGTPPPKILRTERDKVVCGSSAKIVRKTKNRNSTEMFCIARPITGFGFPSCPREKRTMKLRKRRQKGKINKQRN